MRDGPEHPPAFLTMPTSARNPATGPNRWDRNRSGLVGGTQAVRQRLSATTEPLQTLVGCNQLAFDPTIESEPTTNSAASSSGLNFNLDFHDEGLTSAEGTAQSQVNETVVKLPEGFTINPSSGVGLAGCTEADYAQETISSLPGEGCPNESKLGDRRSGNTPVDAADQRFDLHRPAV